MSDAKAPTDASEPAPDEPARGSEPSTPVERTAAPVAPAFKPWVTIFLAVANVAVFGWELSAGASAIQPDAQWMLDHGGNFGPSTFDGQQWRLLTSMFLHYGLLHLAMNMIGLFDGGRHVERMYGHAGFAALYLVSGLAGSLVSGLRGNAVSAGASGAVFGVFGAFGAFLLLHRDRLDREQVAKQARGLGIFVAYNVVFGMSAKGIDLAAHVGGLVSGFACGIALELGTDHAQTTLRRALLVAVIGLAAVGAGAFTATKPHNAFMALAPVEEQLLGRWNQLVGEAQAGTLADRAFADAIETELLPAWRKAREEFTNHAEGDLRADMLEYLATREVGWQLIAAGLRAQDEALVTRGMKRFAEGEAIIERIKTKAR